ncbi:MAG: MATE family efflux transporter [Erysipelothrix sp.]|nr:MATE family efflux transporter [Erysipelothrix sp.]
MKLIRRFFAVDNLIPKKLRKNPLPSTKEAYFTAFQMAWPSSMEMVLIGLIGSADLIMVSHLGSGAIAAAGITTQPKFILLALVMALNTGLTVIISRRKGQDRQAEANKILMSALILSVSISFLMSLIGFIFAEPILLMSGATTDYIDLAVPYFRAIAVGNFFTAVAMTLTSAQRGAGNTKISMVTNLTANVVNIIFNYLLIYGIGFFPEMGVVGAGIATMIGNIVAFIISIYSITRKGNFVSLVFKGNMSLDFTRVSELIRVSSSAFIEQIFIRGGFLVFAIIIAKLGTDNFATHQVVVNILNLAFAVGEGLSIASATLVGMSLGKERPDLAMLYSLILQRIGLFVALILGFNLIVFRTTILSLFSQGNSIVLTLGNPIMIIVGLVVSFQVLGTITIGTLRGGGDLKFTAFLMMTCIGVIRPVAGYLFAISFAGGLMGAWFAILLDQAMRTIISQRRFADGSWLSIVI